MSLHTATLHWTRADGEAFTDRRYHRAHAWRFDGGAEVAASASPHVVPPPGSDPSAVDPEEAFVAALSSCHLLWFLDMAARAGHVVDAYEDAPEGTLGRDAEGGLAMTRVVLRPRVAFATPVEPAVVAALHHEAHAQCFLARSVRCAVDCEPRFG